MTASMNISVEERILRVLRHLGIEQAHFAGRSPRDWAGLAIKYPEVFFSFTLVSPFGIAPHTVSNLASRLLVFNGDQGPLAENVQRAMQRLSDARLVTLRNYDNPGWADVVSDYVDEMGSAMLDFLAQKTPPDGANTVTAAEEQGEIAGISYRMRGSGPPLVLLPLFLAPSQWEPLVPRLSLHYCTITLGGAELGAVAVLESRGRATGYRRMLRALVDETQLRPGETVLDVGCGTGVLDRWLVDYMGGGNRVIGIDINRYLLQEATTMARREGLEERIEFREGNVEALLFPDCSFDVTISITVIEEVDADRMLDEMVRVTKPGGRIAVIARAMDMPFMMNVQLQPALKAKVNAPGVLASASKGACADASLYRRFRRAGLTEVRMFPQLPAFDGSEPNFLQFMQGGLLTQLTQDEVQQWYAAQAQAEAEGTFFMAWPHHCAVGSKMT
jgi:ubiquinone/menaquinone biosynthesis C-methylase UbiE